MFCVIINSIIFKLHFIIICCLYVEIELIFAYFLIVSNQIHLSVLIGFGFVDSWRIPGYTIILSANMTVLLLPVKATCLVFLFFALLSYCFWYKITSVPAVHSEYKR